MSNTNETIRTRFLLQDRQGNKVKLLIKPKSVDHNCMLWYPYCSTGQTKLYQYHQVLLQWISSLFQLRGSSSASLRWITTFTPKLHHGLLPISRRPSKPHLEITILWSPLLAPIFNLPNPVSLRQRNAIFQSYCDFISERSKAIKLIKMSAHTLKRSPGSPSRRLSPTSKYLSPRTVATPRTSSPSVQPILSLLARR